MLRRNALRFVLVLLGALPPMAGCLKASASGPSGPGAGLLFVGNSLTYWNDLPLIVQAVFDAARRYPRVDARPFEDRAHRPSVAQRSLQRNRRPARGGSGAALE